MTGPFDDRPFVAGVVRGTRAFHLDPTGNLTGCVRRAAWSPGLNQAACLPLAMAAPLVGEPHRPGTVDCSCGFYAYFGKRRNPYADRPFTVAGIIEGSGIITIGPYGFRAEKARIVALVQPDGGPLAVDEDLFLLAQHIYGGVSVYPSMDAAMAAHPLTKPSDVGYDDDEPDDDGLGGAYAAVMASYGALVHKQMQVAASQMVVAASSMRASYSQVIHLHRVGKSGWVGLALAGAVLDETAPRSQPPKHRHPPPKRKRKVPEAVARRRAAAESAAARRAGLRGTGGIDYRRRSE